MKKSFLILAGAAALTVGAYFTNYLFAQQPTTQPQAGTKIACINVGQVFNNYKRAAAIKADLERQIDPFKQKGKKLVDDIKSWQDAGAKTIDPKVKDQYEASIVKGKRDLEDMQREIQKLIGERQKNNMMTLWKEINMGIKVCADSAGYQVVLAYGDPVDLEELGKFDNVSRKMNAMDQGGIIPIYVHGSADISDWVTRTLNKWSEGAK